MTIQEQIDQLKKEVSLFRIELSRKWQQYFEDNTKAIKEELSGITGELEKKIEKLQDQITDTSKKVKPTRYYPNGAYMDEPEAGKDYWLIYSNEKVNVVPWTNNSWDKSRLAKQNCFPTIEAAEKELSRQNLTAKMYRDMRDERINGEWVADWDYVNQSKYIPSIDERGLRSLVAFTLTPIDFYYRNKTFIEDLKAMGWTEEELKIVWFRV